MKDVLFQTILKIKATNPKEGLPPNEYMGMLQSWKGSPWGNEKVPDEIYLEACKIYNDKNLYDKPVLYLKGIIKNLMMEKINKKNREVRELGTLPMPKL